MINEETNQRKLDKDRKRKETRKGLVIETQPCNVRMLSTFRNIWEYFTNKSLRLVREYYTKYRNCGMYSMHMVEGIKKFLGQCSATIKRKSRNRSTEISVL